MMKKRNGRDMVAIQHARDLASRTRAAEPWCGNDDTMISYRTMYSYS